MKMNCKTIMALFLVSSLIQLKLLAAISIPIASNNDETFLKFVNPIVSFYQYKNMYVIADHIARKDFVNGILNGLNSFTISYIMANCSSQKHVLVPDSFILLLIDTDTNSYYTDCIKLINGPASKVFVVQLSQFNTLTFNNIVDQLKEKQIFNLVVLSDSGSPNLLLYDYFPDKYRVFNLSKNTDMSKILDVKRKSVDLQQRSVNILVTDDNKNKLFIGKEVLMYDSNRALHTVFEYMNGTLKYINWNAINIFGNSLNVSKNLILEYRIMVILNSEQDANDLFEHTYSYEMEYVTLIVPKSQPMSLEESLMNMYSQTLWLIFVLYSKVLGFVFVMIRYFAKEPWRSLYCYDFNVLFDPGYARLKKTALENMLILISTWFTFFAFAEFQVIVITTMTSVKFLPQIQTLAEVCGQTKTGIWTFDNHARQMVEVYKTTCPDLKEVLKNVDLLEQTAFINGLFLNDKDYADSSFLLEGNLAHLMVTSRYNRKYGLPFYFMTRERLLPRFKSYLIKRDSPFYELVNRKLIQLYEGGFQKFWSEQLMNEYRVKRLLYPNDYVDASELTKVNILKTLMYFLVLDVLAFVYIFVEIGCKKLEVWLARRNVNLFFWTRWTYTDNV